MDAFVAGILDNAPILPDLDDAVKTHEIIFAADRSAATGQSVKLPLER
jgi:predicted dehydrogenase